MTKNEAPQSVTQSTKNIKDSTTGLFVTKFSPEYAADIVEYMAKGHTLTAASGKFRVTRKTIYNWMEEYPEFKEAVEVAFAAGQAFKEEGLYGAKTPVDTTKFIFALKTSKSGDWKETNSVELSGPNGDPIKSEISVVEYTIVDVKNNSDSEK